MWVLAPPVAGLLGYSLTRLLDLAPGMHTVARAGPATEPVTAGVSTAHDSAGTPLPAALRAGTLLGAGLVVVGGIASFAMGANDVANATGSLVGTGTFSPLLAGLIGGAGLALGVLTWGRPLLSKVAFDIVTVDRAMATAAQLVQGVIVLVAVTFGYFTSMNQALVGAMAGAGVARGRDTVHRASIIGILRGWLIGPAAGFTLGLLITLIVSAAAGTHMLLRAA